MSATTVSSGAARGLKRLWNALPVDRWLSEAQLDELLLRAAGEYQGDHALASAYRDTLVAARALDVRAAADGFQFRRAEWIDHPEAGPGSDAFNRQLAAQHEANLRELDRQRGLALEDSPLAWQRKQLEAWVAGVVTERLRPLEEAVTRLYSLMTEYEADRGAGREEDR